MLVHTYDSIMLSSGILHTKEQNNYIRIEQKKKNYEKDKMFF
jgi:hypothetical protein